MPVICWGALGKAANDSTTIDEEINAYIRAHDANVNAHGLSGYAVYIHRTDVVIDHVDYSVTTDKISADQIVGKDFRTAPGVGLGQDGVLFNPQGIAMYQSGVQRVNIPVSGDATFRGIVEVNQLRFLAFFAQTFFESVDQWAGDRWGFFKVITPVMGNARFSTISATGATYGVRISSVGPDQTKNPFFEATIGMSVGAWGHAYFGWGALWPGVDDTRFGGFADIKGQLYAAIGAANALNMYHIAGVGRGSNIIYRSDIVGSGATMRWIINGHVYHSVYIGDYEFTPETTWAQRLWITCG